jgi:hypothetical protein
MNEWSQIALRWYDARRQKKPLAIFDESAKK